MLVHHLRNTRRLGPLEVLFVNNDQLPSWGELIRYACRSKGSMEIYWTAADRSTVKQAERRNLIGHRRAN
jgi:hypothetical protein